MRRSNSSRISVSGFPDLLRCHGIYPALLVLHDLAAVQSVLLQGECHLAGGGARTFQRGSNNSIGTPGTEYLNYSEGEKKVSTAYYGEAVINYDRTFADRHKVTGMLIGTIRHSIIGNAGSLEASLPSRNLGLSGRFTYGYDSRYLLEFNFGYNGSENFASGQQFGFFPAYSVAWNIAEESIIKKHLKWLNMFKLRYSYGKVGNDNVGTRFPYVEKFGTWDEDGYYYGDIGTVIIIIPD